VLRLRLAVEDHRADSVTEALEGTGGVHRVVSLSPERAGRGVVLAADVIPSVADDVMDLIREWEVAESDYLLTRQDVIAPSPASQGRFRGPDDFSWVEVMGEARAHARPLSRYLAMMSVAAVIAAMGVTTGNAILIVGAMAVSPDLLPVCAACVAIVGRRMTLARRATGTLLLGIGLTWVVAAALAAGLEALGILSGDFRVSNSAIDSFATTDYSTVLVALGLGQVGGNLDALVVLGANVTLLLLSGSVTLALQRWISGARAAAPTA
jgi:hypothetical protein